MSAEHGEKIVSRAIIIIDGKALLGKRGRGIGKGRFALIGGKPEGDETPEQTASREVLEETNLIFTNPIIFLEETDDKTVPGQVWHVYYFLGEVSGDLKLKKNEVLEVIYANETDLKKIDIAFDHREILEKFFASRK